MKCYETSPIGIIRVCFSFGCFRLTEFEQDLLSVRPDAEIHVFEIDSNNIPPNPIKGKPSSLLHRRMKRIMS
jgi:hypothetical protein